MFDNTARILCYGDSNTWGYISGSDHERLSKNKRWTGVLQTSLGDKFEVIEEGLNSRTLTSEDTRPGKEGKNGYTYLIPCLDTHDPIDVVVIMLGTNEMKANFNKTAEEIGKIFEEKFVKTILQRKSQFIDSAPKLVVLAPPLVNENADYCQAEGKYIGGYEKSVRLVDIYRKIVSDNNCVFIDNSDLETGVDGVHINEASHALLARKVEKTIKELIKCKNYKTDLSR